MDSQTGERRDVFGIIVVAALAIGVGSFFYFGAQSTNQNTYLFGGSSATAQRPPLPTVTTPNGR